MDGIDVGILGPFRVLVAGRERSVPARKHRALVALLALYGRRSRADLIVELWPDSPAERGRESLRHALYRLRAAIGEDLFATSGEDLALADRVSVDARELERLAAADDDESLERALTSYRGALCAELETADAEAARVRLRGVAASAAERLALRLLADDPRRSADVARRAIEIDPYREEAHRVLLRALAGAGDVASAATHYRRLVTLLRDELGVDPSGVTKKLYADLSREGLRMQSAPVGRPSLEPPVELIGRRAEYAQVIGLVSDAIDGHGGSALLVGEAGAGKSRLLDEIVSAAEQHGLRVLRARAVPAEGALPFRMWLEALRGCASEAMALAAPWPSILSALLPEAGDSTAAGGATPQLQRTRLFESVVRLLAQLADATPTVLALDDLHHADDDSLHLFHYVARTARDRRLAIVAAARPASGRLLDDVIASLDARAELRRVALGSLAPEDVAQLLGRFGVRRNDLSWLAPRVARWTGGNPLFALEAMRALIAQGRLRRADDAWAWSGDAPSEDEPLAPELPPDVRQTILSRVGMLPDATRRLLDLAATIGARTRLDLLAAVAGRELLSVADDLVPALEAALVHEHHDAQGTAIGFAHELVRDATYQRIPIIARAAMHRRVADALERMVGPAATIAFHLTAAGEPARAVDHWLASAREADERFAHDEAARAYRAALTALGPASPRRLDLLARVGDAEMRRGAVAPAVAAYEEAIGVLSSAATDERASLSARIARAAKWYHRHPRALELVLDAVAHERARGRGAALAEALLGLAWVCYVDGDGPAARAAAEEAREIARGLDLPRVEAEALHVILQAHWLEGDALASISPADVDRLTARLGEDEQACALYELVVPALMRTGDATTALTFARRELDMARRIGSLRAELKAGEDANHALLALGRYADAVQIADEVRRDVASLELSGPPALLGGLAVALAHAGREERAVALCEELLAAARARTERPMHGDYGMSAVNAILAMGRLPSRELLDALRPACRTCEAGWLVTAGRHAVLRGDFDDALQLAAELESHPRSDEPGPAAGPAHIRALAFLRLGRPTEAAAEVARARELLRAAGSVLLQDRFERDLSTVARSHA